MINFLRYIVFNFIGFVLIISLTSNTDKNELIKRKSEIEKEIELTDKLLTETRKKQQHSLQELQLIKNNLKKRNLLIKNLSNEIKGIDNKLEEKTYELNAYKKELEKAKQEYATLIYYAFKNRDTNFNLMYLLAAKDINQFYNRFLYLKQYKDYRLKNIELIKKLKIIVELNIQELTKTKNEKRNILNSIKSEKAIIINDEESLKNILKSLQQQEKELIKQIDEKKKIAEKLNKEIEELITKETKKNKLENLTPEDKLISNDFIKNKGRLPWPVEKGVIVDHFGEHDHPVIKNVKVRNNGIDIATIMTAKARTVFEGDISKIFTIKGANTTVIIRHGNFYTVYHNLKNVNVHVGEKVNTKQYIGDVYYDAKAGETILHFEVWNGMEKQDPEDWLSN